MQSSRGPGAIGMILALVVVLGFGLLFMFAFDEGLQGGGKSIESVINSQAKEIENLKDGIESGSKTLNRAPVLVAAADGLIRSKLESKNLLIKAESLKTKIKALDADLNDKSAQWETYKDEYRAFIRSKAKGQVLATLEIKTGEVFNNVNIREVSAIGIQIRHDNGFERLGFEELTAAMQDYYQYDPAQKNSALAAESAAREKHEADVAVVNTQQEALMAIQREKDDAAAKAKLQAQIAEKQAQIDNLTTDIAGLDRDKVQAQATADAARAAGKMHLSKAGSIDAKIRYKQTQISTLRSEISALQSRL